MKKYLLLFTSCLFFIALSLKTREITPLIPRKAFFGNAQQLAVTISPDGKYLAYLARIRPEDETSPLTIWIQEITTSQKKPLITSHSKSIWLYYWAPDSSRILYLEDTDGDENWQLYGIERETLHTINYTPFEKCQTRIIEINSEDPSTIAIALNKDDPQLHDIYILNLHTGTLRLTCKNPGNISHWALDKNLRVRAALKETVDGGKELLITTDTKGTIWKTVRTYNAEDSQNGCSLLCYSSKKNCLYLLESKGYNTTRLVSFSLRTKEITIIMQDPSYDITNAFMSSLTEEIEAITCEREKLEWQFIESGVYERLYKAVSRKYPGTIQIESSDATEKQFVVSVEKDVSPLCYYLYDDIKNSVIELCKARPCLKENALCPTEPISLESRDGLMLYGYLTVPRGKKNAIPMVLLVHDGPWRRVRWRYNAITQWLANRGYAVLDINYRGSTGYGKKFMNAGNKEWGGAMQDDLLDAVAWAIKKGIADQSKIAIFGGSYGGYAALAGAAFTPDVFCCAIDLVGISNLISFLNSIPPYWNVYRAKLYNAIGNPDNEKAFLESRSPLFKADAIKIPILIAQGAQDPRVKQEESEQIIAVLKKRGIPHTYLLFNDEGHVFTNASNKLKLYATAEEFLSKFLGGRCEP
ncbi:S9 family peptidase [Candidatus Dependentiae bacterium]|nr:S9 family peptidase [Candidatus Dependentiae bacterium]